MANKKKSGGGGKVRSAKTGRYVSAKEAKRNPGGTVTERDKSKKK